MQQEPTVTKPTVSDLEHPSSAFQDENSEDMHFSAPRKSRLGAPQIQTQLSRLTDRTRPRRLKEHAPLETSMAAGYESATRTSPTSGFITWTRVRRSVLTPQDCITNVQNRAWTGFFECRLCGSFLDTQQEHRETCNTPEATRGHHACVHVVVCGLQLADLGITTEPRGATEAQPKLANIFTTGAVPGRSTALDVCVASSQSSKQLEETRRKRQLMEDCPTVRMKSQTCVTIAMTVDILSGRRTGDSTLPSLALCSMQQTSHPAGKVSRCQQNPFSADGNMISRQLFFAREQP